MSEIAGEANKDQLDWVERKDMIKNSAERKRGADVSFYRSAYNRR